MMRDTFGPVSTSLLACWVCIFSSVGYGKSNSSKRLLWNEKLKEISSFRISGRDLGSVPVVSTVRLGNF